MYALDVVSIQPQARHPKERLARKHTVESLVRLCHSFRRRVVHFPAVRGLQPVLLCCEILKTERKEPGHESSRFHDLSNTNPSEGDGKVGLCYGLQHD